MSRETSQWLNTQTLIGFTDKRGNAWHYRIEDQGNESNHYPMAIPVPDVLRRLFNWEAVEEDIYIRKASGEFVQIPGRKAMVRNDTFHTMGIFKSGYQGHQYSEWLLENVALLLDDELGISSAGLLRDGAQAWVEVSVPETITTPEGVVFLPNLLATTSFDGSLATTLKRTRQDTVCDNTRDMALSGEGEQFKVRHSKYSGYKIRDAREALAIIHTMTEDFIQEIHDLCAWKVTEDEFQRHMQIMIPINDEMKKAGITRAESKREQIMSLYNNDARAAEWSGTAYGVSAAYNTWRHHFAGVKKGVPRVIRNMENVVTGKMGTEDRQVLTVLADVTGRNTIPV